MDAHARQNIYDVKNRVRFTTTRQETHI